MSKARRKTYHVTRGDTSGRDRKLHSQRSCRALRQATSYSEATVREVEKYGLCKRCEGDVDRSSYSRDHLEAALQYDG